MRKWLTLLVTMSMVILSACSSTSTSTQSSPKAEGTKVDQKVNLRWYIWSSNPEEKQIFAGLAKKVTEKYPDITVTLETENFTNYWDKLQTQLASGTGPDIITMQSQRNLSFQQAFEPLNDYIKKTPEFKFGDFEKSIVDALAVDGKQVAIPYDWGPYVLYYNKDLFKQYGVPFPDYKTTWDQFREKAKAVSKDGHYGFVYQPSRMIDQMLPWVWSNGGEFFDKDQNKSKLQEPAATEALQFLDDMIYKDKAAMPITDPGNANYYRENFYSGKVAMYMDGPWNFYNVRTKAKFDWDITTLPTGKAGNPTWVAGSGFGIYAKSKHKDEAWKAITVMLGQEGEDYLAKSGRAFPARKSSLEAFKQSSEKQVNLDAITEAAKNARPFPTTTNWQELELNTLREMDRIWFKNEPAAKVTKDLEPTINKILEDHAKKLKELNGK